MRLAPWLLLIGLPTLPAHAHPPSEGELGSVVVVKLPFPVSRPPGDAPICFTVSPTLQTANTELDEEGVVISCTSDDRQTRLCVSVDPTAPWPASVAPITCTGEGHQLKASFKPGHDPSEPIGDGITLVRARGPFNLGRQRTVRFQAADEPNATGEMPGGSCTIHDGVMTLEFEEPVWRSRSACTLTGSSPRTVPIRWVDRRRD